MFLKKRRPAGKYPARCLFFPRHGCPPGSSSWPRFPFLQFLTAALLALPGERLSAQHEDTTALKSDLGPVTIKASRLEATDGRTPLATTVIGSYRLQHSQQQLAMDEMLGVVPGLFAQNGSNFAQDVRIAIRGYGSRAAFGIRGIKILLDGFPETSPDGQGQVDNIDPAVVNSVLVIRGGTAALYGNASGGQLSFSTLDFDGPAATEAALSLGSFGFGKLHLKTGSRAEKWSSSASFAGTRQDGYRQHSSFQNYLANTGLRFQPDSLTDLTIALNAAYSPEALDPGALTIAEAEADRSAARERNRVFDAGEKLWQARLGLAFSRKLDERRKITASAFQTRRGFSNKLAGSPAEIVSLERVFSGAAAAYTHSGKILGGKHATVVGIELERQADDRERFANENGSRGNLLLDQTEQCDNIGMFLSSRLEWSGRLLLYPGLRLDAPTLKVDDKFLVNGDDSGRRAFRVLNPMLGASYALNNLLNLYASIGRGFETPTFTEFANPQGLGGFNPDLQPQRSVNTELGVKGSRGDGRLKFDAAAFYIRLAGELVAQESDSRVYYKNAGASSRKGLEASLSANLGRGVYAFFSYTFSDFRYETFSDGAGELDGKSLPGIPRHNAFLELRYFKSTGLYLTGTAQLASRLYTSDLNDSSTSAYALVNLRLGYLHKGRHKTLEPFLGVNNVMDAEYYANIRINGFSGRYYEPAAGINFFGGFRIRLDRGE